ncbi:MAG: hypothetical protein R2774_01345 [Saprospiraceae bacterium]
MPTKPDPILIPTNANDFVHRNPPMVPFTEIKYSLQAIQAIINQEGADNIDHFSSDYYTYKNQNLGRYLYAVLKNGSMSKNAAPPCPPKCGTGID